IDVEDRVIVFLSYLAEGGILRNTCIREHYIELALLLLDLCEEAIKITEVRHVSLYARYISSNLFYRSRQLRIASARYEDVRAFVHKLLRSRKTDAARASCNECCFSFKPTHASLLSFYLLVVLCERSQICFCIHILSKIAAIPIPPAVQIEIRPRFFPP